MALNCKPGDLAIVIRDLDAPENIGRLVTVIGKLPDTWIRHPAPHIERGFEWEVKPVGKLIGWWFGKLIEDGANCSCPDADLRPIRDEPGVDETLLWAPVPNTTKEKELA